MKIICVYRLQCPPCTLEIKFSTQESKGTYDHNELIIGGIQRNARYNRYKIAWGIMIKNYYGEKYIKTKINDDFDRYCTLYDGYYRGGKVINDGEPHTIRLCIDTNSYATIYEDGKLIITGTWKFKSHIDDYNIYDIGIYLGGYPDLLYNRIIEPTTFYYVKIAKKNVLPIPILINQIAQLIGLGIQMAIAF